MPNYIEYQLDENTTILIEGPEEKSDGIVKASLELGEVAPTKAKKTFSAALKDVRAQAKLLLAEIEELQVSEAEIKFGINTVGELGNMAIGKIGVGVNYEVTLKWKKSTP
ncbi:MAG: hypothetical protein HY863_11420 [Chloroflexi bacterium]|nr:hypothetical protein [Chloroflexota bacterium]